MIIEIDIYNLGSEINILIDMFGERLIVNNMMKKVTKEQIDELLRIIRDWKNEYGINNKIDGERFLVKIKDGDKIEIIKGEGGYPDNYHLFKEWIRGFYE